MALNELQVVHFTRPIATQDLARVELTKQIFSNAFELLTCQRHIFVRVGDPRVASDLRTHGIVVYENELAYEFLLRLACGLESILQGETDIFGQLKTGWKKSYPDSLSQDEVSKVFQSIFEDTKEIRHRFIQNSGGQSYGSLVRLWLKRDVISTGALLVGTGPLARSVFPYLLESQLFLANRSEGSLQMFFREVLNHSAADPARVSAVVSESSFMNTLDHASAIVLCVPKTDNDALWVEKLKSRIFAPVIIHLGIRRGEEGVWKELEGSGLATLDEILELQKEQGEMRSLLLKKAELACRERAKHRSLGFSLSTPHGWEDLALFS